VLSLRLLPTDTAPTARGRLDVAGALTITSALIIAVFAIVKGNEVGWVTFRTLGLLAVAVGLLGAFLAIESRVESPLIPLGLFRNREVSSANLVGILMAAGLFAYFFFSALYLQLVKGYTPLQVGLAYLPGTIVWGASSLLLSDRLVMRFGIKKPLIVGMGAMFLALLLLARVPVDGNYFVDILPATIFIGIGAGIAFNPILLAAMHGVEPTEAGLASGVVNTSFMMGGAVGLAILASLADSRTTSLADEGHLESLTAGYHLAFLVGAIFVALSALLAATLIRATQQAPSHAPAEATSMTAAEVE